MEHGSVLEYVREHPEVDRLQLVLYALTRLYPDHALTEPLPADWRRTRSRLPTYKRNSPRRFEKRAYYLPYNCLAETPPSLAEHSH